MLTVAIDNAGNQAILGLGILENIISFIVK